MKNPLPIIALLLLTLGILAGCGARTLAEEPDYFPLEYRMREPQVWRARAGLDAELAAC